MRPTDARVGNTVTGRDAMLASLAHAKQFPWKRTDIVGRWETWQEVCRLRGAECDGHHFGCLQEFARLCRESGDPPWPEAYFVIGHVAGTLTDRPAHAWIGFRETPASTEEWGDPTPGYVADLHAPWTWNRTPEWGFPLNIDDGVPVLPGFPYERT